jgi:hypothetical protein
LLLSRCCCPPLVACWSPFAERREPACVGIRRHHCIATPGGACCCRCCWAAATELWRWVGCSVCPHQRRPLPGRHSCLFCFGGHRSPYHFPQWLRQQHQRWMPGARWTASRRLSSRSYPGSALCAERQSLWVTLPREFGLPGDTKGTRPSSGECECERSNPSSSQAVIVFDVPLSASQPMTTDQIPIRFGCR